VGSKTSDNLKKKKCNQGAGDSIPGIDSVSGKDESKKVCNDGNTQGTCIAKDLMDQQNAGVSSSDAAVVKAANTIFDTKVSRKVKLLIAFSIVAVCLVSFMLGKFTMNPIEIFQTLCFSFTNFLAVIVYEFSLIVKLVNPDAVPGIQEAAHSLAAIGSDVVTNKMTTVLYNIRSPRILVVMLVGAALSVAGASYQGMFKNPLTSPDLLGASAGASLGACIALLLDQGGVVVQLSAFAGGMIAVGMAVWLNRFVNYDPTLGLVLAGILVSTLFSSGMSLVKFLADATDKLPTITFWLMGSFAAVETADLLRCLVPMALGFIILWYQAWKLNVLSFGDEEARVMGVNTARTRLLVIFASTLITSTSVAVAGVVGWIGLVIPHLSRAIVGPNYKALIPTAMFVGAVYLLIVDNIARMLISVEVPIGILTAIMGVPFFVFIFKRNMKGWR